MVIRKLYFLTFIQSNQACRNENNSEELGVYQKNVDRSIQIIGKAQNYFKGSHG